MNNLPDSIDNIIFNEENFKIEVYKNKENLNHGIFQDEYRHQTNPTKMYHV